MKQSKQYDFKDHVCGMKLSRKSAIDEFNYQGKTYYFCARVCKDAFESEPEKYIGHHRQHGIKSG